MDFEAEYFKQHNERLQRIEKKMDDVLALKAKVTGFALGASAVLNIGFMILQKYLSLYK